jgi:hypothetical protein
MIALLDQATNYVVMLNDSLRVISYLNLKSCISELKATHAFAFYFAHHEQLSLSPEHAHHQPIPVLNELHDAIVAWSFMYADYGQWRNPYQWGALYRKKDIVWALKAFYDNRLSVLQVPAEFALDNVGVCYKKPKMWYVAH